MKRFVIIVTIIALTAVAVFAESDEPNLAAGERVIMTFAIENSAGVVTSHNIVCDKGVFVSAEPGWAECSGWQGRLTGGDVPWHKPPRDIYPVKVSIVRADGSLQPGRPPSAGPINPFTGPFFK